MPDLVEIGPHPARSLEVREGGKVLRVHLAINSEQDLDRVEVDERADLTITAWVGWKADARHLHDRSLRAAGTKTTFIDVRLSENLAGRAVRDGASPPAD
jgi:hypothetical protein